MPCRYPAGRGVRGRSGRGSCERSVISHCFTLTLQKRAAANILAAALFCSEVKFSEYKNYRATASHSSSSAWTLLRSRFRWAIENFSATISSAEPAGPFRRKTILLWSEKFKRIFESKSRSRARRISLVAIPTIYALLRDLSSNSAPSGEHTSPIK
jgi:hypothetical protein